MIVTPTIYREAIEKLIDAHSSWCDSEPVSVGVSRAAAAALPFDEVRGVPVVAEGEVEGSRLILRCRRHPQSVARTGELVGATA